MSKKKPETEVIIKDLAYYMALPYPILLTPVTDGDDTQWSAEIPLLGGMMVHGATIEEVVADLEYAKGEFMAWMLEDGDVIAEPAEFP